MAEFSEETRKAKFMGIVMVYLWVDAKVAGRIIDAGEVLGKEAIGGAKLMTLEWAN